MKFYKKALFILLVSSGCVAQQSREANKSINSEVKKSIMSLQKINLAKELNSIEPMTLKKITTVNDHNVNLIYLKGDYKMHRHKGSQKLFMVVDGTLFIELKDKTKIEIKKGEIVVIPKGLNHKPSSPEGVSLLFFEK